VGAQELTLGAGGNCGFCLVDLKSGFRIGLGNVIILWAELHKWREKILVLLISQKDYVTYIYIVLSIENSRLCAGK